MIINTNIAAINSQRHLYQTNMDLDRSLERLSSGLRINSAADDASGLAIADKMNAQRTGMTSAIQNTQDSAAFFKIAEGALSQTGKMLSRIEELTVRAANLTLTSSDRSAIAAEISELINQIDTVSNQTEYNTMKILNGGFDIQTALAMTTGTAGSVKVLETANTAKAINGLVFSVISVGSAAFATAAAVANVGPLAMGGTITINGVDISVLATDTADTVVTKVNAQNSKTGVLAVRNAAGTMALVTGAADADATNIVGAGATTANGSAIGYVKSGSAARISLGGTASVWSGLGFTGGAAAYNASGTNAVVNLGGVALTVDGSVDGHQLEMTNSGSFAYGMKIAINLFNGYEGGAIFTRTTAITSAIGNITASADLGTINIDTSRMLKIQIGANYNQNLSYSINAMDSTTIGSGASSKFASLSQISVASASDANLSLKVVQKAITDVADTRAAIGSILNRLDYTDKTLQVQRENMAAAESKIRDADVAQEMSAFTRQQILMQAGTSMLAQANSKPQNILQLLK